MDYSLFVDELAMMWWSGSVHGLFLRNGDVVMATVYADPCSYCF